MTNVPKLALLALLVAAATTPSAFAAQRNTLGGATGPTAATCKPPFVMISGRCADDPCPTGEHYNPNFKQCVPTVALHCGPGKVAKNGVCVPA